MHIRLSISRLPNETVLNYSSKERRKLAIQFLPEHPNETIAAACRLYHKFAVLQEIYILDKKHTNSACSR
jgi:hypothetical protein